MTVRQRDVLTQIDRIGWDEILTALPEDRVVVTDENVVQLFPGLEGPRSVIVPAGESSKSLSQFAELLSSIARTGASRRTTVVAVGGGVVGDLAGYAAASFMRGVPFMQVPTTLLAQVDSAVGGKVGVDLPEGKNLAGAFKPSERVLLCHEILAELPERQVRNGLAECLKYRFILDAEFLADHEEGLPTSAEVDRCVAFKAAVVEEDEFETTGRRAILNFGHTVGHAVEKALGYQKWLHGEAIAAGMVVEAELGERLGITERGTRQEVESALARVGLPTEPPPLDPALLIEAMKGDKKARGGRLAFSLLEKVGACRLVEDVPEPAVREVLGA